MKFELNRETYKIADPIRGNLRKSYEYIQVGDGTGCLRPWYCDNVLSGIKAMEESMNRITDDCYHAFGPKNQLSLLRANPKPYVNKATEHDWELLKDLYEGNKDIIDYEMVKASEADSAIADDRDE